MNQLCFTFLKSAKHEAAVILLLWLCHYLYINSERWYLSHVPSTFATVNTHANVFFVFLPGCISKEWRQIVSSNCDFDN